MSTTQSPEAAYSQHSTIDGLLKEFGNDDPSLSENALMIIVIGVCCLIAIVFIFIIIGFLYTKRPSAAEVFGVRN